MKKRSPVAVVVLSIVTFGIYDIYWLVKVKKVLNEKTKFHTPTIWLLIVPWILLIAGYTILFTASIMADIHSNTGSSISEGANSSSSSSQRTASGEQLSQKGERRPSQYLHICNTSDRVQYVSQGDPKCLGEDSYQSDYTASVAGTVYSSPCETTSGTLRYVYISTAESCPSGTRLVFYNNVGGSSAELSTTPSVTPGVTNDQTNIDPTLSLLSIGLIAIGFITSFIASVFWFFQFSKAINEYTRGKMNTAVTFLILWMIHLIGVALIQDTFNDMDDEGIAAGYPAGPTTAPAAPLPNAVVSHHTPPPPGQQPIGPAVPPQPHQPPQPPVGPLEPAPPIAPPSIPDINHHHTPEHGPFGSGGHDHAGPGHHDNSGHSPHSDHSESDYSDGRGDRT